MGLFWNWKKTSAPTPAPTIPQFQPKEKQTPVAVPTPVSPELSLQPKQQPQPSQKQEAEAAKPLPEIEMRKVLFRFSSLDPQKCDSFVKEMLRKLNKHDWHTLSGRIGKHVDGVKMRMEIKGKSEDIDNFLKWCKTDHVGVHIYQVVEFKVHRMPYPTTYPPFQELHTSWPTA